MGASESDGLFQAEGSDEEILLEEAEVEMAKVDYSFLLLEAGAKWLFIFSFLSLLVLGGWLLYIQGYAQGQQDALKEVNEYQKKQLDKLAPRVPGPLNAYVRVV